MKKAILFTGFIIPLVLCSSFSSPQGQARIDEKNIMKLISQLASDEMQGRKSGLASGHQAEKYIFERFREIGLKPGGRDGTYYQTFNFPMSQFSGLGKMALLEKGIGGREYKYGDDYYFYSISDRGHIRAEVIFIGYGISSPKKKLDEYKDINVEGKILLCLSGVPNDNKDKWKEESSNYYKADQAFKHKALSLLLFDPEEKSEKLPRFRVWSFNNSSYKKGLIFGRVGERVVNDVFEAAGPNPRALKEKIDITLKPYSSSTGKILEILSEKVIDTEREAANIIGKIPGTDPVLRDEVVIISGHYDGGGVDPDGIIYNGANDNASGIGVLLEIARVMMENNVKPLRSILFVGWGAEEQGGYGSKYFVENPLVPLERIASVFVLDCVGLGEGRFSLFGAKHFSKIFTKIKKNIPPHLLEGIQPRKEAGSDQYFFQQREIPSFFAHNICEKSFNHTPDDDTEILNPKALKSVAEFIYESALYMANER